MTARQPRAPLRMVENMCSRWDANRRLCLLALIALTALASGCGTPREHFEFGGRTRTYILHVPPTSDSSTPIPLVVALHQFADTAAGMQKMTGLSALADREGFAVVYPEGIRRRWRVTAATGTGIDDVGFLSALIDHVAGRFNIDRTRIYVTGASNGAMMTHLLACKIPEKIAAIAPVFGTMTAATAQHCSHRVPMPVVVIHGTDDPIVRWRPREEGPLGHPGLLSVESTVSVWVMHNACDTTPDTTTVADLDPGDGTTAERRLYRKGKGYAEVVLYAIHGGGHTWPGSKNNYPRWIVGKTCMDFDASEVIWRFFEQHARTQAVDTQAPNGKNSASGKEEAPL